MIRRSLALLLRHWFVAVPTVLALVCFSVRGVDASPDSGWYLVGALNLAEGRGFVDTDGTAILIRPVFPGVLALTFALLGTSVLHAFWVVRVFFVGSIALLSWLGYRLCSPWAGLGAGLLALTAVRISEWYGLILLDGVVSVMLLLTVTLVHQAYLSRHVWAWYGAAGVVLGIALLTKEVAIVLLPLPLLALAMTGTGDRRHLVGSGIYVLAALLVVGPWAVHVYSATGSVESLLGAGEQVASRARASSDGGGLFVVIGQYLAMTEPYYSRYLAARFILAPLWIISWLYSSIQLWLTRAPKRSVLVASFLLYSPVALITAKNGLRPGQTLFLEQLSCVAVAILLSEGSTWLGERVPRVKTYRPAVSALSAACLVVALFPQVILDREFRRWVRGKQVGHAHGLAIASGGPFVRRGWVAPHIERAAQRIREEVPAGSVIMSDWHWRAALYFFTRGAYTFIDIPHLATPSEWPPRSYAEFTLRNGEKPLFILPRRNTPDDLDMSLLVFTQSGLIAEADRWNARWVVVTHRRRFLGLYFDANPGFMLRMSVSEDRIRLYERTRRDVFTAFETLIGSNTARWLEAMHSRRPEEAVEIERFLTEEAGLTRADLDELRRDGFRHVSTSKGY